MNNTTSGAEKQHKAGAKQQNMVMAALSYVGPLVLIPYLAAKEQPFVKFHIKQGLVLFAAEIALWVLSMTFWPLPLWMIFNLINIGVLILAIIGIVNVINLKETKLPLVGDFARYFTF